MPIFADGAWEAIAHDFSDLRGWPGFAVVVLRLVFAALLGGMLGFERMMRRRSAGLRTHMLVSVGSALFLLIPQQAGMSLEGQSRVIQGLLAGIGFLGAGAILKPHHQEHARGLTTAAGLWLTAAVGMGVGMGRLATATLATLLALIILAPLRRFEERIKPKDGDPGGDAAE